MFRCLKRGPGFYGYLWRLTGPIALQNLITFSLGLIDTLMVSWLGNTQMAAVTTANVPVFLLISIVFGVQSGLGILVSQYWGKKDMESISRAIGVAAMLGTGLTVVLAAVLYLWPVEIMDLLSNNHELSVLGAPYLKLIGISYVFNMLSSLYVSARRSAEEAPGTGMIAIRPPERPGPAEPCRPARAHEDRRDGDRPNRQSPPGRRRPTGSGYVSGGGGTLGS